MSRPECLFFVVEKNSAGMPPIKYCMSGGVNRHCDEKDRQTKERCPINAFVWRNGQTSEETLGLVLQTEPVRAILDRPVPRLPVTETALSPRRISLVFSHLLHKLGTWRNLRVRA